MASRRLIRPFTVIVEGNIGSGKTSCLNYFSKYNNVFLVNEPVDMWRNCNGKNLLAYMYEDPVKWSFTFQSYVQLTMLQNHQKETSAPLKLMERSIYSARYCFVEKLLKDELLPKPAGVVIDKWFHWITKNIDISVDLIVYLRTSPETAYERILKRNRSEENNIAIDYINDLHKIHEDWLYHKTLYSCPAPVLILNGDLDKSNITSEYDKCESYILENIPPSFPVKTKAF